MTCVGQVVMYHYVRERTPRPPAGIRPLFVDEFEQQLDFLQAERDVLHPMQFLERLESRVQGGRLPCLLTFDDGTRDHLEVVAPILARRGLAGLFFVPTWPAQLHKMPLAHAVHWALSLDEASVWAAFENVARDESLELGDPAAAARYYHYEDSEYRKLIKYAANVMLAPDAVELVVRRLAAGQGRTLESLVDEWFLNREEILRLAEMGNVIGMHGESHQSLQQLGADGIRAEVSGCSEYLTELLGETPAWFSCPFGGRRADGDTYDAMQLALREQGIRGAVSVTRGFVTETSDLLELPRFDAVDLPPRSNEFVATT